MMQAVVVAAAADGDLVDRWRDLGPVLWAIAGGSVVVWLAALGVAAMWLDPRRVAPGAAVLDVVGDQPPAVVNLLTTGWDLNHAAVPATLVDLAARGHVAVDQYGDDTVVRPLGRRTDDRLTDYEGQLLGHLRSLGAQTGDGRVPAEALSTGPAATSRHWWRSFRSGVVDDARRRGLSRPRWSPGAKAGLMILAAPVALAFALAGSSLPDDPASEDDNPVAVAAFGALLSYGALGFVVAKLDAERDTPAGREVAARWLGVRELLGEDPLFGEQPPAAVAIWDRLLAHGTALGVAHGVVRQLPLGAESDREAWSSVGGRWRVVRVRYRRPWPPFHGQPPAKLALAAIVTAVLATGVVWALPGVEGFVSDVTVGTSVAPSDGASTVPSWWPAAEASARAAGWVLVILGACLFVAAVSDLLRRPRAVEGRALRHRQRGSDKRRAWYIAVDDGTSDRVRAFRHTRVLPGHQGARVRLTATPFFRYVRQIDVLDAPVPAPAQPRAPAQPSAPPMAVPATTVPTGPPPPLPDAGAVSAAAGRPLSLDTGARPHPLAEAGAAATFRGDGGEQIQLAWTDGRVFTGLPGLLRKDVPSLGPGASRVRIGRGLLVPRDGRVLMVLVHLPRASDDERDRVGEHVARAALAQGDSGRHATYR
jgi:Predicted membrane protein (DUF2207) C-terminal domain